MNSTLAQALADFRDSTRHEHWYGKTFGEFWTWFRAREEALLAQADTHDVDALRNALLELTADCDDAGFAVPDEATHDVIKRPV